MEERTVKLYGISEETVRAELIDLINKNDVNITVNTVDFEIHIKLVGKEINKASELIYLRLGRYIYGENEDSLCCNRYYCSTSSGGSSFQKSGKGCVYSA